jgi:tetratricopeptide (TPR) repeat protein
MKTAPDPNPASTAATPATPSPFFRRPWFLALLLAALTFIAYAPAFRAGFIWDDDDHLTANPAMTAPHGLRMIWSSLAVSRYYPLTLTSFWVQRRVWGLNPTPYHLVNIALHAINGILVFSVLRRLRIPAAWLAAMLWVLHPVNVESVAWITELKNLQSGVFFFVSLLLYFRFEGDGKYRWYALALLSGLAAVLSKPSTVVLPIVLLLCAWWQRRHWRRTDFVRTVPFFALAVAMSVLTVMEQRGHVLREGSAEWKLSVAERLGITGKAVWFYAAKLVWPARLTFVYPRWAVDGEALSSWMALGGLIAVGIVLWRWRRQAWARAALFGFSFFVAALLPVLGFFDVYYFRYSFVADHFQYLASIGLISLVVSAGAAVCQRTACGRGLGTGAAAIALLILGALTWGQARVYRDPVTLWDDTLSKNPLCWLAHNNLGNTLLREGRVPEAIGHYEQALWIKPDCAEAHANWGNALLQAGMVGEAIGHYEQALRILPQNAGVHNNLANALLQAGKVEEAIGQYEQTLRIDPDYAVAHYNWGLTLMRAGRLPEAIGHYEQAVRIKPDYVEAHDEWGNALMNQGRLPEAIGHYEQALRIQPENAAVHNNLASALLQAGRIQEAIGHYEQAVRIQPRNAAMHNNLANALLQAGKVEEAIGQYEQALRINPDYAPAHYNLGNALLQAGKVAEAIGQYEQALQLRPDYAKAHDNLGVALEKQGRRQEAIQHYEQAVRIQPDFAEARSNLERARAGQ